MGLKADHRPEDKLIENTPAPNQSLGFSLPIAWSLTSNGLSVSAHKTFFYIQKKNYLSTFTINKLQLLTTCKIAELIEAGSMETCLLHYTILF